jgi:D-serine dehydratase
MTIAEPQAAIDALLATRLRNAQPALWTNPARQAQPAAALPALGRTISLDDTHAAAARLARFAGLLAQVFPELTATGGVVESPLLPAAALAPALGLAEAQGRLFIKADHSLPVAGSIKARGGMHEVLEFAEGLALQHGLVEPGGDYRALATPQARELLGRYQVAVGSTGNLGMSIGVVASALGFQATVHMSADAKEWKKDRLRQRGVQVVEHAGDYERAVAAGRAEAASNPQCHFVDDEQSFSLLLGYSAAALHLQKQLAEQGVAGDAEHPLIVYLPCGVGGAPAGITFGLRQVLGPHVHCFFAEPVQSPCFMVQMMADAAPLGLRLGPDQPHRGRWPGGAARVAVGGRTDASAAVGRVHGGRRHFVCAAGAGAGCPGRAHRALGCRRLQRPGHVDGYHGRAGLAAQHGH